MNNIESELLNKIMGVKLATSGAYSLRKNGKSIEKKSSCNVKIISKKDKEGIDIFVKDNTKNESIHIPVIITEAGVNDKVYNDFYIGKNADVIIYAGCGIHNDHNNDSFHSGIHSLHLEENAKVKYIEKHYGEGDGSGKRILNPVTEVYLKNGSSLEMETVQIKGVDSTQRETIGILEDDASLIISEKIMTHGSQIAKTFFDVKLNGKNSSTQLTSRSVAVENSCQEFESNVLGNNMCFAHVECDAIIKDNAKVVSVPKIIANNVNANLIHEAAIGKIAGEQLLKLMTLGLTEQEAKEEIIKGFLK